MELIVFFAIYIFVLHHTCHLLYTVSPRMVVGAHFYTPCSHILCMGKVIEETSSKFFGELWMMKKLIYLVKMVCM